MPLLLLILIFYFSDFLIKICIPLMNENFLDVPNHRSAHTFLKLKSGGIFFTLVILMTNLISISLEGVNQLSLIIFICTAMAIVGLVDDLLNLSSKIRYGFQLLVSFLIIYTVNFELFVDGKFIQYFPLLILGTAIINCINFMDGIDGLLTGCLLPLLIYAFLTVPSIQLIAAIGSLLAFLKWNWEPSKIFMGDCGSNFLGALTFYLIISNPNLIIDYKVIFIIFPLVIDSSFTIIRRYFNKENIFIAHKKHLYQRLLQTDNNHWKISSFYITICLINFLIILKDSLLILITGILGEVFALLYLDKFIAKKFK